MTFQNQYGTTGDVPPAFRAELRHAGVLIKLLRAIHVPERPKCIITASHLGLKATCENSTAMQGSAILLKRLFQSFDLRQEYIAVKVNLSLLLKCVGNASHENEANFISFQSPGVGLDSVSEDVSLKLMIRDEWSPLELEVTDGDLTTSLSMGSEEGGFHLFPDIPDPTARLSLPSCVFGEMFLEFDPHSEELGIRVDGDKFRIFFQSDAGKTEILINNRDEGIKYEYESEEHHHSYLFRLALIKETLESLVLSKRTTITTTETVTSFRYQILVNPDDGETADIEYVLTAKYHGDEDPYPFPESLTEDLDTSDRLPIGAEYHTVTTAQLTSELGAMNVDTPLFSPVHQEEEDQFDDEDDAFLNNV